MTGTSDLVLLARITGSLVVVVLVALLAARLARRAGIRSGGAGLRVLERVGLTREAGAVVLEVDGRRLLLGVTSHDVRLLADLTQPHVPQTDAPQLHAPQPLPALEAPGEPAPPWAIHLLPHQPEPTFEHVAAAAGIAPAAAASPARPTGPTGPVGPSAAAAGDGIRVLTPPLSRRAVRAASANRRPAMPPTQRGTGSVLDPRTWRQGVEALRDLTARRG